MGARIPRWGGDTRGHGVGDARALVPGAVALLEASACAQSPFELVRTETDGDGTLVVALRWRGDSEGVGEIRRALFALVGSFAETATYVRQRRSDGCLTFELVTGSVDGDSPFAPHGHSVRLGVDV